MKILLSSSTILVLIFFSSLEGGLTSCTKDKTIYDTVTVIKNDTITIKDTVLTAEILTDHAWKFKEIRGLREGTPVYYLRGGSSNTESFDNAYISFNADKTGLVVDNVGASHTMTTWDFANAEHTKLVFTLYNNATITSIYTWDNLRYKNNSIYYDDYYTDNLIGNDYHGQGIIIPK